MIFSSQSQILMIPINKRHKNHRLLWPICKKLYPELKSRGFTDDEFK